MYTVDSLEDLLERHEFNIRTKDGMERVKGYTALIDCIDGEKRVDNVGIGVHKGKAGFWVVTDLETGRAITTTLVWRRRKDALGAFLQKYPAYSRLCIDRTHREFWGESHE